MAALAEFVGIDRLSLEGLPLPVTMRPSTPLSDDELIAFSRKNRPYRIERNAQGEVEIMSPVNSKGSHWEAYVIAYLFMWADANGGLAFSSNGGFTLPDSSMRSPDAAWIAEDRWNALAEADQSRYSPVCPDFLVEILSETDSRNVLESKMEMWIANGAQLAWMIDPFAANLTIYRPGHTPQTLSRPDWVEADTVVPGFRLETSRLWAK